MHTDGRRLKERVGGKEGDDDDDHDDKWCYPKLG